jgi:heme/copper-type cytochrome/quinol oxidase subunit 3
MSRSLSTCAEGLRQVSRMVSAAHKQMAHRCTKGERLVVMAGLSALGLGFSMIQRGEFVHARIEDLDLGIGLTSSSGSTKTAEPGETPCQDS